MFILENCISDESPRPFFNEFLKEESEESFITAKSEKNTELELQLEILKHVIQAKIIAKEAAEKASETKARIERIQNLIIEKKEKQLGEKSVEELEAELNALKS